MVLAVAIGAIAGCTTKRLETTDTSTTTSTRATSGTTSTSSSSTSSSTTSTTADASTNWSLNASEFRGQDGLQTSLDCPPNPASTYSVWGTGTYTDDSSVCTAGVHAGRITFTEGGTVRIEIAPGLDSYEGSEANGVTSSSYGPWGGSFFFVDL